MNEILKWIDTTPADLETRLNDMPENVIVNTPSGTSFVYIKASLIGALISLQELAAGITEEPEDYAKLSMLYLAKARIHPEHYEDAIETLRKIPEHRITPEQLFQYAKTLFSAYEHTNNPTNLQEAYERAIDYLTEGEKLDKNQHHWIGKILAEQADNAPYSEKSELYERAIRHLEQAITGEQDATGHHLLAEKQEEYADDCPDLIQKEQLRRKAIKNYKIAYKLTNDEGILESIRELEA